MIYLDNGATSFHKPQQVVRAVQQTMRICSSPGRGGYPAARQADREIFRCRQTAASFFHCQPEQVVLTTNCTHGLNIAIRSLVKPGMPVAISGFEHNAVVRPLHALGAELRIFGRKLFDWEDTLDSFRKVLDSGVQVAVFTHVSNVFGYILPVEEMADMCRKRKIPFVLDAAQSAGSLSVDLEELGAEFIAIPGHKGLLGPQGTGLLLCRNGGEPLLYGGTGTASIPRTMPEDLPERLEAGTLNVPGYAGLRAGMEYIMNTDTERIFKREHCACMACAEDLKKLGMQVFTGEHQAATVSFVPGMDCEEAAQFLANQGIAVRAGLHCAPLAHESAGTLQTGTVRVSFGHEASIGQKEEFIRAATKIPRFMK